MDAKFVQQILAFDQHVDQMRDRRALVAADIGNACLEDRLGDREDAFATKDFALAETQRADFFLERALRIGALGDGNWRLVEHGFSIGVNAGRDDPVWEFPGRPPRGLLPADHGTVPAAARARRHLPWPT